MKIRQTSARPKGARLRMTTPFLNTPATGTRAAVFPTPASSPFPRCVYEVRGGMRRYQKDKCAREIIFQHGRGFSVKQIARMLDENLRTVQRVIKEFKRDTDIDTENEREVWDE
ncbi:MAG: hypothetical protein TUN42_10275 [Dehalogenimonas sp.]